MTNDEFHTGTGCTTADRITFQFYCKSDFFMYN